MQGLETLKTLWSAASSWPVNLSFGRANFLLYILILILVVVGPLWPQSDLQSLVLLDVLRSDCSIHAPPWFGIHTPF